MYLPVFRIADLWLRLRTEKCYDGRRDLPFDQYWWRLESVGQSSLSIGDALLNAHWYPTIHQNNNQPDRDCGAPR
ncbi:hypothetical protein [uncultured Thiodictyon sp.]|uniref:hypothetical protein n=1 Tax=uncultured Thiodictyon sp. TaxID=1846217 RepID=UPI0025CF9B80|nr:hypothetical protein [uncultured Thiodictyon sp.]